MNLYQKLVEIQKTVRGLGKDANAQTYQYVSGAKVLDRIRPKMDELGVLLVQQVDEIENDRIDYAVRTGSKSELLSKVTMTFTWIDAESGEKLPVKFGANGMNNWDKGLGSALTYAERYFLLKFFHIATDEDDVDALPPRGNEEPLPQKAAKEKEIFDPSHPKWQEALEKMASGVGSIAALQKKYIVPASAEQAITDYLKANIKQN
jgi:hypothetical protein